MQDGWLKEKDVEIASLKSLLSLKEAEAAEAIRLHGQVSIVEAAESSELDSLREQNAGLEGQVAALESAAVSKNVKLASSNAKISKVIQDLSNLQLSCDELRAGEVMQDEQVKFLSDKVVGLDADIMEMALHLDEEFYLRYLTTIARRRWILGYGGAIGRAIVKGMQDGLASHKDGSMVDIMGLLRLEGPTAEILGASQLQPSPEKLMIPIHRLKDQVVIGETSLSFSLDVAHDRVQILRGNATAQKLSISDALVPLVEPLSAETLVGEVGTFEVPATATSIALSTAFIQAITIPPVLVTDHEVSDMGPSTKVSSPPAIVFEKETLETTPEHGASD
ncbi:hypothetical protein Tco_0990477 [Tanacetum coccineum]|uniref:Uncharacterized protein n=1 Tax=Tanacetum coccineum TaxID=301880 RepID=A0ABQ5EWL1_9ASTR